MWTFCQIFAKVGRPSHTPVPGKEFTLANLTLPIPSPVPLDVLSMSIDTLLDRVPTEHRYSSVIVTPLANVCQNYGIETVWMLATNTRQRLRCLKGCGPHVAILAETVLEDVGCRLGMFIDLHDALGHMRETLGPRWSDPGFPETLMALAGIGDWAKNQAIIAALKEHGLRPGMPLEELFVYVPVVTEPTEQKKLTVAEEIERFGVMKVSDVFSDADVIGFDPNARMVVVLLQLAVSHDQSRVTERARKGLIATARQYLSPKTLAWLGIFEK